MDSNGIFGNFGAQPVGNELVPVPEPSPLMVGWVCWEWPCIAAPGSEAALALTILQHCPGFPPDEGGDEAGPLGVATASHQGDHSPGNLAGKRQWIQRVAAGVENDGIQNGLIFPAERGDILRHTASRLPQPFSNS